MARGSFFNTMLSVSREIERAQNASIRNLQRIEKEKILLQKEEAKNYAEQITIEAENSRALMLNILNGSTELEVNWDNYIFNETYKVPKPIIEEEKILPQEPSEIKFHFNILEHFKKSLKDKKIQLLEKQHSNEIHKWELLKDEITKYNNDIHLKNQTALSAWESNCNEFYSNQEDHNNTIRLYSKTYSNKSKPAVEFYINSILALSQYPDYFPNNWGLEYDSETGILIIDYSLPLKNCINNLKQLKYITTRNQFSETFIKDSEIDKIYDSALYQISLRVTYEIYNSDLSNAINSIAFNGWITDINKSTGNEETKCILSLFTNKIEFEKINLFQVDPKLCFQKFKGRSGAKLSELVPVAPIINLDKEDRRFVDSYVIGEKIDGLNIAAMHWKDFENLIRELFEKEFCKEGAEIKITQASRDGGVDAVMFDPDPLRGGKIVIQAKRYTNVVGVSAVRDLYGTVLNEGATKGILITTSYYGNDSYEFMKDKPLTLIDGSNLLHLLEKNGYKARIDLIEAKKIING